MNTELSDNELDFVSGGNVIGDAMKVIGAMASAVNKALENAANQQIAQTLNLMGEIAATPPKMPGL